MIKSNSSQSGGILTLLGRQVCVTVVISVAATLLTLVLRLIGVSSVLVFLVSGIALAALASMVGHGTDQLGCRLGAGATGVLQSALGNLPELFISIFALRAGLLLVVQTALVGSILANSLLVLGLAFTAGGLKNGVQTFGTTQTRMISILLLLSVAALSIPAIATAPGAPDSGHPEGLSVIVAVVLLLVFAASIPFSMRGGPGASEEELGFARPWPLWLAMLILIAAGTASAFVSDWFVDALRPSMVTLGISESFVGMVIVAIAGNAVENVVGVQMAIRNNADLAVSLILNSSLQVALALIPALVIISRLIGGTHLTLVLSPLLIASLGLAAILGALIVYDGESTWLEGLALMGLYVIIAASFWWGPAVKP
ncbi:MAG TPA: calcium/proton exchanger [Armatimonadota bacterium]|nr:calcium/proton exchanger [Armatimonadota bacterium]